MPREKRKGKPSKPVSTDAGYRDRSNLYASAAKAVQLRFCLQPSANSGYARGEE